MHLRIKGEPYKARDICQLYILQNTYQVKHSLAFRGFFDSLPDNIYRYTNA